MGLIEDERLQWLQTATEEEYEVREHTGFFETFFDRWKDGTASRRGQTGCRNGTSVAPGSCETIPVYRLTSTPFVKQYGGTDQLSAEQKQAQERIRVKSKRRRLNTL